MERPSKRKLIPPISLDISYILRAPKSNPRIGPQYQVEVPSMIKESERVHKVEDNGYEGWRYLGHNDVSVAEVNWNNSWSDADVKNFLLGLFIFGKNFLKIQRFLENKEMGEILSFYYGKFYKSDEYCRWSNGKKVKKRKCKLFSGQKHIELLSRLTVHVSEEHKDALQQVSKCYSEERTSLEEYVSSLKSIVGIGVLVEAVGIGKARKDLTSAAMARGKKTQACSTQASKAWSSLGPCDIIKHLSEDYQSSKARSNDIFWEAVWPRLLARGWHSEKLKNQGHLSSKNVVVFLLPGVKKFSKRKLVKGEHYFDSVRDVLSKVIAEPNLLKLQVLKLKVGGCNEEKAEKGSKEDGQPDNHHQHCYLKHQDSTNRANHMKDNVDNITATDTGVAMLHGKENNSNADCQKGKHERDFTSQNHVNVMSDNVMAKNWENHSDLAGPPFKLLKLSAHDEVETCHNFSGSMRSEKLEPPQSSCIPDVNKNELGHDVTISSSAEASAELENERRNINGVCLDKGISCDNNFNEPQVLLKSDDAKLMETAKEDEQNLKPKDITLRRSTRNRPLTVRALESLTNKFLHPQRKGKRKDTLATSIKLATVGLTRDV